MKVACPQCGQHYDIDSNMLDRYYRCTECKTLFWGLKAKSVKVVTYKRKDDAAGDNAEIVEAENSVAATGDGVGSEGKVVDKGASESDSKQEILIAVEAVSDKPSVKETVKDLPVYDARFDDEPVHIEPVSRIGLLNAAALGLGVILAIALVCVSLVLNNKIDEVNAATLAAAKERVGLQERCNAFDSKLDSLNQVLADSRAQLDALKKALSELAVKVNDPRVASQIAELEENIALQESKIAETLQSIAKLQESVAVMMRERNNPPANSGSSGRRNR